MTGIGAWETLPRRSLARRGIAGTSNLVEGDKWMDRARGSFPAARSSTMSRCTVSSFDGSVASD